MLIQMINQKVHEFPDLIQEFNQILPLRYQLNPKVSGLQAASLRRHTV